MELSPHSLSAMMVLTGIRSLVRFGKARAPLAHPVLYPRYITMTLPLKTFRREPDISEFDWPFTPSHSSSPNFSTLVGSVLHSVLPEFQPGHG